MDKTRTINFTMETTSDIGLEFLDFKKKVRLEVTYLLNLPTALGKPHLTPVILKRTYVTYLKA